MRAINHAMTGAVIGLAITAPVVAMPIAFFSHFALDALPHFGFAKANKTEQMSSAVFMNTLLIDIILCLLLALAIFIVHPRQWLLAMVCAFLATSPDLMWLGKFIRARKGKPLKPVTNQIVKFHGWIQWYEKPPGAILELIWLGCIGYILVSNLYY